VRVKKTLKGNIKITLTAPEADALWHITNYSKFIGVANEGVRLSAGKNDWVSQTLHTRLTDIGA